MILNSFVNISVGPFRRLGFVPISKQKEGFLNFESMSHFSNERRRFFKTTHTEALHTTENCAASIAHAYNPDCFSVRRAERMHTTQADFTACKYKKRIISRWTSICATGNLPDSLELPRDRNPDEYLDFTSDATDKRSSYWKLRGVSHGSPRRLET